MAMHVIFPGPRTTVQDKGRLGYQNSGFAPGGFIDKVASRMANVLVDNQDDEAVLEFCLIGPILEFDEEVNLAVCGGDFGIDVGGKVYPADKAVHVPAGATVRITTGNAGTYGSLAVAGGLDIPEVMGSRSTNLRCGIGGFEGRALRAGDVIGLRHPEKGQQDLSWRWVPERQLSVPTDSGITKVRVVPGPQEEMFTEEGIRTFYESAYEISSHSDRMGFRLSGPAVASKNGYDILSDGIVNGSVQISGTGEPIVMMADRQTTGGYANRHGTSRRHLTRHLRAAGSRQPGCKVSQYRNFVLQTTEAGGPAGDGVSGTTAGREEEDDQRLQRLNPCRNETHHPRRPFYGAHQRPVSRLRAGKSHRAPQRACL